MKRRRGGSREAVACAVVLLAGSSPPAQAGEGESRSERREDYRCLGGETFSAIFAADGQNVTLVVGETSRKLEAAEDGDYFTADAVFFGDDPETGAFVAEGETVILQACRPEPAKAEEPRP